MRRREVCRQRQLQQQWRSTLAAASDAHIKAVFARLTRAKEGKMTKS
jgi:hypothetical protein